MSEDIRKMIDKVKNFKQFVNEVNYLNPNQYNKPKNDNELDGDKIRVYHGFSDEKEAVKVLTNGLSGKENIKRERGEKRVTMNGLYVTINLEFAKQFTSSGIIFEFSVSINDLIKTSDDYTSGYDNLLSSTKSEALYVGDLNPNMIKYVWYSKDRADNNTMAKDWVRMGRKEFINKNDINTKRSNLDIFLPNDDFDMNKIIVLFGSKTESIDFKRFVTKLATAEIDELSKLGFLFPKQIKQIIKLRGDGFFVKYL
jgi:hypothetical protein